MPRFEKPPYYITAYGLAVKRGFKGTLDEWLNSLRGCKGDRGDKVELRYLNDKIQWRWIPNVETPAEETETDDVWHDLVALEDIRGDMFQRNLEEYRKDVVLHVTQSLTLDQQAQARDNIKALKVPTVTTVTKDHYLSVGSEEFEYKDTGSFSYTQNTTLDWMNSPVDFDFELTCVVDGETCVYTKENCEIVFSSRTLWAFSPSDASLPNLMMHVGNGVDLDTYENTEGFFVTVGLATEDTGSSSLDSCFLKLYRYVKKENEVSIDEKIWNSIMEYMEQNASDVSVTAKSIEKALGYVPMDADDAFTTRESETPDYTNLFPVYGYESGQVLSADGSLSDTTADRYVSGFIPVTKGDVVRIKDPSGVLINNNTRIALYTSGMDAATGIGKTPTDISSNAAYGTVTVDGDTITWDTSSITYYNWNNFAYLRVTVGSANAVVTVNEELTQSVKEQYILRPEVKVQKDSLDFEVSDKPLSGKTVVCFGDSLFGMHRDSTSAPANIALKTGATVHNVGFGGCRMSVHPTAGYAAFSMWALAKAIAENIWVAQDGEAPNGSSYFREQLDLLQSIDFDEVDMVVIHYGTNDFTAGDGVAMDNADDPDDCNTLCGALRYSVEKLLGAYPKLQIFVSLPVFRYWTADDGTITYSDDYINSSGQTLPEFVEALRGVAEEYHLPVIDGYHGMGVNKLNASAFLSDGTHHNEDGRKLFGEFIGGQLISTSNGGGSGTERFVVTVTDGQADKTNAEIYQACTEGKDIVCILDFGDTAIIEHPVIISASMASFSAATDAVVSATYIEENVVRTVDQNIPTDSHINALINTALGVIENGTY